MKYVQIIQVTLRSLVALYCTVPQALLFPQYIIIMSQYDFSNGNRNFGNPISNVDWNINDECDDDLYGSTTMHTVSITVQF